VYMICHGEPFVNPINRNAYCPLQMVSLSIIIACGLGMTVITALSVNPDEMAGQVASLRLAIVYAVSAEGVTGIMMVVEELLKVVPLLNVP